MWTRRCKRKRLSFPPTPGCITKRAACWCGKRSKGKEHKTYEFGCKASLRRRDRLLQQLLHPTRPNPLTPPHQTHPVARQTVAEKFFAAETLPATVLYK